MGERRKKSSARVSKVRKSHAPWLSRELSCEKAMAHGFFASSGTTKAIGYGFHAKFSRVKAIAHGFFTSEMLVKAMGHGFHFKIFRVKAIAHGFSHQKC